MVWGVWSDHVQMRAPFVFAGLSLSAIGFGINICNVSVGVKYFGTFLVVIGGYAGFPAIPSWWVIILAALICRTCSRLSRLGNNLVGHYRRGTGLAIQAISEQVGGIIASNIYRTQDAQRYITGRTCPAFPVQ